MIFFIPARKNSKRLPNKNMYQVAGKPLIQWTFDEIKNFNEGQDCVVVSSDDEDILKMALSYGFTAFERPENLSLDETKMSDVLFYHVPDFELLHEQHEVVPDVCVLYPTCPLRTAQQIKSAVIYWESNLKSYFNPSSLMSVELIDHRPYGLMSIKEGFLQCNLSDGYTYYQSQVMPESYRANGAIYIFSLDVLRNKTIDAQLFTRKTMPFLMDKVSSLEVDSIDDIKIVEAILARNHN